MTAHLIAVVMFGATWAPSEPPSEPGLAGATGDVEQPAVESDAPVEPASDPPGEAAVAEPELAATPAAAAPTDAAPVVVEDDASPQPAPPPQPEYGPFFESEAPSDTAFPTPSRKRKTPVLSVGNGAFCFVNDTHCKSSLILSAGVAAGMRVPASDAGPDMPYAQFSFVGGLVVRPLMLNSSRRDWHAWGVGVVGSWSRGTGSVTVGEDEPVETKRTDAWRIAALNQIWLSKKNYGVHLDLTLGGVRSDVLTSGVALWGTHAEVAFGWGGWGELFAAADFLDRDSRIYFGLRGHGIAAGPVIGLILAGLALGGAM